MHEQEKKLLDKYLSTEQVAILVKNDIYHLILCVMDSSRHSLLLEEQVVKLKEFDTKMRIRIFDDFLIWHRSRNLLSVTRGDFLEFLNDYKGM